MPTIDRNWLPTNQSSDFTVVSPFTSEVASYLLEAARKNRQDIGVTGSGADVQLIRSSETVRASLPEGDARIQYCFCYEGRAISLTVRAKGYGKAKLRTRAPKSYRLVSGYQGDPEPNPRYLVTTDQISECVFHLLEWGGASNGFLIVSGGTNSMKTELALSLIERRLNQRMVKWIGGKRKGRKPHLVTCEDNIEKYFLDLANLQLLEASAVAAKVPCEHSLWMSNPNYPDYTPRLRDKDADSLESAVNAALRMTPEVFYAGEIRKPDDWKYLYKLAQSHLVVLTTHASSLVNTFAVLQRNLDIRTAAQRSELAASIHSVIHMKPGSTRLGKSLKGKKFNGDEVEVQEVGWVLPAFWTRTPLSVAAYTADGASSLTPENVQIPNRGDSYCVGRQSFASAWQAYASDKVSTYKAPSYKWTHPKEKGDEEALFGRLKIAQGKQSRSATIRELQDVPAERKPQPKPFEYRTHRDLLPDFFQADIFEKFFDELIETAISLDLQGE